MCLQVRGYELTDASRAQHLKGINLTGRVKTKTNKQQQNTHKAKQKNPPPPKNRSKYKHNKIKLNEKLIFQ